MIGKRRVAWVSRIFRAAASRRCRAFNRIQDHALDPLEHEEIQRLLAGPGEDDVVAVLAEHARERVEVRRLSSTARILPGRPESGGATVGSVILLSTEAR